MTLRVSQHNETPLMDLSLREPLAVLLLCTDILREYGGRLTYAELQEQREAMHHAAQQLAEAVRQDPK